MHLPPSVSCHTIPSSVTEVPGSHGPKQSGSVIVPTDVPTHTSTISFGSHLTFLYGGGLQPLPLLACFSSEPVPIDEFELDEEPPNDEDDEEDEINWVVDAAPTAAWDLLNAPPLLTLPPAGPLVAWFANEIFGIDCDCEMLGVLVLWDCVLVFDVTLAEVICEDEWIISGGTYGTPSQEMEKQQQN